jgi:tetratricopeptide (TPR) repeat protein
MTIVRILAWCLLFFLAPLSAVAASPAVLSGVVRDGDGKPLSGVSLALTGNQGAPASQATSNQSGEYRFPGFAPGDYTLSATLPGYSASTPLAVHLASPAGTADLTLNKLPAHQHLEFQASGIRGLIDPGGYSASTAGAASGLLRGIADVRRTDKSTAASAAKEWPCSLEPALQKAAAGHPDQAEANRKLGQFYTAHNQPARAIPLLQRALAIDPADYAASKELAVAWLQSGEFEKARKLLTPLAEQHPDAALHQLLARADEGTGLFREAAGQYRIADGEEPSEESLFGIGYELVLAGSVPEGAAAFQAGVARYPRSIPLRIGLGTALYLQGKTPESLRSFLSATDIDPADPRAYSFIANALGIAGDESERIRESFKRYLDRKPASAAANYFYALALSRDGNPDPSRIEPLLKRAIQLDPNLGKAHLQLADSYAHREDYDDALPEYEAAVRLAQDSSEAHYRLAMADKHLGKADAAAREMQIFKILKEKQASGTEGVDLAQFISVMDTPDTDSAQRSTGELQCPTTPH